MLRTILAIIPQWLYAALLVLACLVIGVLAAELSSAHLDTAEAREELATAQANAAIERAGAAEIAASAAETFRQLDAARDTQLRVALEKAHADTQIAEAGRVRAAARADSLQHAATIAANTIRHGQTCSDPSATQGRETGARAAELLGSCAGRAVSLAGLLDRSIIAGQLCEASYDALTTSVLTRKLVTF